MFGSRSVPPARGMALALSPSRMRAASLSVCGARNSKSGSRIMARVPALSPGEIFACGERRLPRCRRRLPKAAGRAVPRANGRAENGSVQNAGHVPLSFRQGRALADFFGAKRAVRIRLFNQLGDHFGHVERGRALVFEDRGELVYQRMRKLFRKTAELLLLHQRFAES